MHTPFSLTAESEMELREEGGNFFLIRPFSRRRGRKQKKSDPPTVRVPLGHRRVQSGGKSQEGLSREKLLPLFTLHAAEEFGHVRRKMYFSFSQIRIIGFMWTSALTPLWRRNPCSDQVFPPIHEQRADLDAQISRGRIVRC